MGLSCALSEAVQGKSVTVIDKFPLSTKASFASAGILTQRGASKFYSPFREFQIRSLWAFDKWLGTVSNHAARPISVNRWGAYLIYNQDLEGGQAQFESELAKLEREKAEGFTISTDLPAHLQPLAHKAIYQVIHFPDEGFVNNKDLLNALTAACLKFNVKFLEQTTVTALTSHSGGVDLEYKSKDDAGHLQADHMIVAAGAWCNDLLNLLGLRAPLVPVKGQMFSIPIQYQENCFIHFQKELYLVPRGDQLMVGVTTEAREWDESFTPEGEAYVTNLLRALLPMPQLTITDRWAGLRPRTKDRVPFMGPCDSHDRVYLCTGHYKSGIGMAPLSAQCISAMINGQTPPFDMTPFLPQRKNGIKPLEPGKRP